MSRVSVFLSGPRPPHRGGAAAARVVSLVTIAVILLTAAPGAEIDKLPPRGNLVRIDELRPERNYSRETTLLTVAELDKQQAEDDKREAEAARQ